MRQSGHVSHDFEQTLRSAGLRVTKPRTAVLDAVHAHPHADSASIVESVRAQLPAVSRQAVFDCLNTFADAGVVRRIQPAGSAARYELRVGDNHHHLVCQQCGAIEDVDCAVGDAPCLHASNNHGYTITEAEVIYRGLCPMCAADNAARTDIH
ncbi:transcriptional repressor [Epidermidibacterium keratini]|uniref:Transcriptional repressor n=1 Tax=Epidermidibacterium keratini TaxID=1891644 RepID=A0A7L4YM90_9ACTN|nr:transcriptional repressor [Epidermidibacterium keratini]